MHVKYNASSTRRSTSTTTAWTWSALLTCEWRVAHRDTLSVKAPRARHANRIHPHPARIATRDAIQPPPHEPRRLPVQVHFPTPPPRHLPPPPHTTTPRSRKPRNKPPPHLSLSLSSSSSSSSAAAAAHGFVVEEERRGWRWRSGEEGPLPCRPQGARRGQPVRQSQAPAGDCTCSSSSLFLPILS